MCNFFSAIVTKDDRILFCESDNHEEIISRAGLKDDRLIDRLFVRVEYTNRDFCVDEIGTLPDWFFESDVEPRVKVIRAKILPAYEAYQKATATAYEAYQKAKAPAEEAYQKAKATAEEAYQKATATAYEAYQKAKATAYEAYQRAKATAEEAYIAAIKTIPGYLPKY